MEKRFRILEIWDYSAMVAQSKHFLTAAQS